MKQPNEVGGLGDRGVTPPGCIIDYRRFDSALYIACYVPNEKH